METQIPGSQLQDPFLDAAAGLPTLSLESRSLYDDNGTQCMSWRPRKLLNAAGNTTLDWENLTLNDTTNSQLADLMNRRLKRGNAGTTVLDWELRALSGAWTLNGVAVSTGTKVTRETPAGAVDGVNAVFTLAFTPIVGTEEAFVNGILQDAGGNDYSIAGAVITFTVAPTIGDKIRVTYLK